MSEDMLYMGAFGAVVLFVVGVCLWSWMGQKKYMKQQKENGTDKRKMLDVMAQVMKERVADYTYAVGNYTKTERRGRTTTYYYYSYILAFNEKELVIFPFVVKDKQVLIRNCMAVDWNNIKFAYKIGKKGMDMTINMAGEKLMMNVWKVQESSGTEKSSEPLGIYQEAEVERLIAYLPQYKAYTGK